VQMRGVEYIYIYNEMIMVQEVAEDENITFLLFIQTLTSNPPSPSTVSISL
jgi:hypothetical protein